MTGSTGLSSVGVFADWQHRPWSTESLLRIGYIDTQESSDPVLSPGDGLDRWVLLYATGRPSAQTYPWQAVARLSYGDVTEVDPEYYGGEVRLEAGRRLPGRHGVRLFATAEYREASAAWEEGTFFFKEPAHRSSIGIGTGFLRGRFESRLSLEKDVNRDNALSGLRGVVAASWTF